MKSTALQWQIHWPTSLLAAVLLPLLLVLGNWQLHRAEEKRIAQKAQAERREEAPTDLEEITDEPDMYTRVRSRGRFDNAHNFFLDNRLHNGRFGYEVVTPFTPRHTKTQLLIDRGWVEGDSARAHRPAIDPVEGDVTIIGSVYRDTTKFNFFKTIHETQWPKLIQNLNAADLQDQLGKPVFPFVVRLEAQTPGAYVTDWQIFSAGFGPERHIAYAVTWFAMALTLVVMWLLLSSNFSQWIRGRHNHDH
jgi:cytochrome oxidase assembly protein ShyY1